jgi:hypothetical protein
MAKISAATGLADAFIAYGGRHGVRRGWALQYEQTGRAIRGVKHSPSRGKAAIFSLFTVYAGIYKENCPAWLGGVENLLPAFAASRGERVIETRRSVLGAAVDRERLGPLRAISSANDASL